MRFLDAQTTNSHEMYFHLNWKPWVDGKFNEHSISLLSLEDKSDIDERAILEIPKHRQMLVQNDTACSSTIIDPSTSDER